MYFCTKNCKIGTNMCFCTKKAAKLWRQLIVVQKKLLNSDENWFCTKKAAKLWRKLISPPEAHLGCQTPKKSRFFAAGGTPFRPQSLISLFYFIFYDCIFIYFIYFIYLKFLYFFTFLLFWNFLLFWFFWNFWNFWN